MLRTLFGVAAILTLARCDRQEPPSASANSRLPVPTAGASKAKSGPIPSGLHSPTASGRSVIGPVVRDFEILSPEQKAAFSRLEASFWASTDSSKRAEILDEIEADYYGAEILALVEKILAQADPDLRQRAIAMLSGNTSAGILPILRKSLADPAAAIRLEAVSAAAQVRDDALIGYLEKAFTDAEYEVRHAGLRILEDQPHSRTLQVLGSALQAPHADIQTAAIDFLQLDSTARGVEVLFNALDAPNPEVRSEAQFSIGFLLDQEFTTSAEARGWWQVNKQRFDSQLVPRE